MPRAIGEVIVRPEAVASDRLGAGVDRVGVRRDPDRVAAARRRTPCAIDLDLPFGVRGLLQAPVSAASEVRIDGELAAAEATLTPGRHVIEVTHARTSP